MTKKELAELRKTFKPDRECVSSIATCYVSKQDGPHPIHIDRIFSSLSDELLFKYLDKCKKSLSGEIGKKQIELVSMKGQQIAEGPFREVFLNHSEENLQEVCNIICDTYISDSDYCILFAFSTYDVPHSDRDGGDFTDSDTVYDFMQCMILPVALSKPGFSYDSREEVLIDKMLLKEVGDPVVSFLYPAFTDRSTDVHHVLFYSKKGKDYPVDLIHELIHGKIPDTPERQKEAFQAAIENGFENYCPYTVLQDIYDTLNAKIENAVDTNEEAVVQAVDLVDMAERAATENGIEFKRDEAESAMKEYTDTEITLKNVVPSKISVSTQDGEIKLEDACLSKLKRTIIDGIDYYLLPAANSSVGDMRLANKNEIVYSKQ